MVTRLLQTYIMNVSMNFLLRRWQRRLRRRNHIGYLYEYVVGMCVYIYALSVVYLSALPTYYSAYLCHNCVCLLRVLWDFIVYKYIHICRYVYLLFSRSNLTKQVLATCDSRLLSHLNSFNLLSLQLPTSTCCVDVRIVVV